MKIEEVKQLMSLLPILMLVLKGLSGIITDVLFGEMKMKYREES
jgi:hypothetical protein